MSPDDPLALTRTHDEGLNAARTIMPDADANTQALAAALISGLPVTAELLSRYVALARAIPPR